jgi:hypothetical protein
MHMSRQAARAAVVALDPAAAAAAGQWDWREARAVAGAVPVVRPQERPAGRAVAVATVAVAMVTLRMVVAATATAAVAMVAATQQSNLAWSWMLCCWLVRAC